MHMYVIYDEETGEVLQTHASYVLGNDEPIAADEEEILDMAREEFGADRRLAVTGLPEGFDPSDRTSTITIDLEAGCAVSSERTRTGKRS